MRLGRDSAPMTAAEVAATRFTLVRLREGYDIGEVDRFLAALGGELEECRGALTPDAVARVRFTPTRLREGYDMGEVDEFLDRAEQTLRGGSAAAVAPPDSVIVEVPSTSQQVTRVLRTGLAWLLGAVAAVALMLHYFGGR